jgi:hypothetical protein
MARLAEQHTKYEQVPIKYLRRVVQETLYSFYMGYRKYMLLVHCRTYLDRQVLPCLYRPRETHLAEDLFGFWPSAINPT